MNINNDETSILNNIDYTPWERKERTNNPIKRQKRKVKYNFKTNDFKEPLPAINNNSCKRSTVSSSSTSPVLDSSFRKECSTLCRHGQTHICQEVVKIEKKKSKDGVLTLLKIQIREKQQSLQECKQRYLKLIKENMKLKDELSDYEKVTHTDAKELLEKYKKYRSALSILNVQHTKQFHKEELDLYELEVKLDNNLSELKYEVQELKDRIEQDKLALKVLLNYKEKEYPDKVEQIKSLNQEVDILEQEFQGNYSELKGTVKMEKAIYKSDANMLQENLKAELAETVLLTMNVSVKEMAHQNIIMKKELEFHVKELLEHQEEVKILKQQISELKKTEDTRIAKRKHPELFAEKCFPDTDFELRIQTQEWLPI